MENDWGSTIFMAFLIVASVAGLALLPVLALQLSVHSEILVRHSLVGALYIVICTLGVFAVFYPAKCKGMFQRFQNPLPQAGKSSVPVRIRGHHPDCQNYSGNRIRVGRRVFCAACSGLFVGAIIALVGAASHFFVGLDVAWGSMWMLALGELWMLLGLAQIRFAGYTKAFVNVVFVVGSFVTLVEIDMVSENLLIDLYALGLIAFMLWVRILLSEWNNRRICQTCRLCFQ